MGYRWVTGPVSVGRAEVRVHKVSGWGGSMGGPCRVAADPGPGHYEGREG